MYKYSDNCIVCGEEFGIKDLNALITNANFFKVCSICLSKSDPVQDYLEVKKIIFGYIKFAQQTDPELSSPDIKIEPIEGNIQKAVDLLKKINPSYFVGVRKIVVDTGSGFGHVSSGPGQDPAIIHLNLSKIKSEIQSKLGKASKEEQDKELVRQIAIVISHERAHTISYNPTTGFSGEGLAEQEEASMIPKIDALK